MPDNLKDPDGWEHHIFYHVILQNLIKKYNVYYKVNYSGGGTLPVAVGIIGSTTDTNTSNCLYLEELLGSGTANQGTSGGSGVVILKWN